MNAKSKRYPPEVFTRGEIDRLLKACGRGPTGLRNRAILMLGWRCGLRLEEVLQLKPSDVDLLKCTVHIRHGKGDKARRLGIPQDACDAVSIWAEACRKLSLNGTRPLFCTISRNNKGDRLETAYVRALLARLRKRADIDKRVHFHGLRHTFAWEMVGEGQPMPHIQRALGHTSLQTTATYLDHIAPYDLSETMKER